MTEITTIPPASEKNLSGSGKLLLDKISSFGKKRLAVIILTSVCKLALTIPILVLSGMFLDWLFDLDIKIRVLLLAIYSLCSVSLVYSGIIKQILNRPNDEELALLLEKAFPSFKSRLISSIQFLNSKETERGVSTILIEKLINETEALAQSFDFSSIIQTKPLKRLMIIVVVVLSLIAIALYQTREISVVLIQRVFLSSVEVPRKTRVEVLTENKILGRGDSILIQAKASGIIPSSGQLLINYDSGKSVQYLMEPEITNRSLFSIKLENLQESFYYRVKLFDGTSKRFRIEVVTRPEVAFIECVQEYPEYTGLGEVRRNIGDLGLLAGSRLKLKLTATKPVAMGKLRLAGLEKDAALFVDKNSPKELFGTIDIPASKLLGFSVSLTDNNGIESKDPALYKIDIIPDKPPSVKIIYPERKEELYTRLARVLIGIDASDDFGISAVRIHYKIDTINNAAEKVIELELNNEKPKNLRRRFEWEISKLEPPPAEGSTIEYWVEVIDNNNRTGPGIGLTERYLAKIVTEAEKRAELIGRINEYLGSLGEVANEQERLSQSLGEIILQKTK